MTRLNGFALALALTASASCSVQGFSVSTTALSPSITTASRKHQQWSRQKQHQHQHNEKLTEMYLPQQYRHRSFGVGSMVLAAATGQESAVAADTSLLGALRSAAMALHTTQQAPKEGKVVEEPAPEPYVPTRDDYLAFLVDSQHVYATFEEIISEWDGLEPFRGTGLERTDRLETDIRFMVQEYDLDRPGVGVYGSAYAEELRRVRQEGTLPEFMCHYYNFYFAHTAGGRMIGKQMASLLLDKKTLEFYKVRRKGCTRDSVRFWWGEGEGGGESPRKLLFLSFRCIASHCVSLY